MTLDLFRCLMVSTILLAFKPHAVADDWPQWLGPQRDGVWRESGILEKFPPEGPKIRWRAKVGAGYSGLAVANGRVFLTDRQLPSGTSNPANPFDRGVIPGTERVLCLNEADGKILWQHEYDCPYTISYAAGPRATPLVSGGKVYTLGAEGHLVCSDVASGKIIWSRDFKKDYGAQTPVWGFAGHPLLDGDKLICLAGGPGSVAIAFDKDSGTERWRALSAKEPGYCPPMIYEFHGRRQLILWHPESINSLDPESGNVFWSEPFTVRSALSIPTPRKSGEFLFITSFYNGAKMMRVAPEKPVAVWQSKKASEKDTDTLHSIMCTPFLEDGYIYGVCSYGQLRCLKAATGERIWETLQATTPDSKEARWANAFLVKNGDRFFLPNEKGDLIIARLSPEGYREVSRTHLLEPTNTAAGRAVVWSHPAFANRCVYLRNDRELVCASLAD
ncbi:MAG: PQQ-like beta-propeller repeat protein [Verrucomicrobia bacterium]|nr:PQQ-like beta-propeller repeat protein [Verrucomicrobiota bacterium]